MRIVINNKDLLLLCERHKILNKFTFIYELPLKLYEILYVHTIEKYCEYEEKTHYREATHLRTLNLG